MCSHELAVLVVLGDSTTSLGVLARMQRAGRDVGIVWVYTHGHFNTEATTPSGYLGGMPLVALIGGRAEGGYEHRRNSRVRFQAAVTTRVGRPCSGAIGSGWVPKRVSLNPDRRTPSRPTADSDVAALRGVDVGQSMDHGQ